jgi:hypothetical protein
MMLFFAIKGTVRRDQFMGQKNLGLFKPAEAI